MSPITPHRRTVGRAVGAVGALAIAGTTLAITAGPASAWSLPQVCSGTVQANACLSGYTDDPMVQVHVGIDVHMSHQDAEAIIGQLGDAFSAALWSDDSTDHHLIDLPLSWEAAGEADISAEFDMLVPASILDEDDSWWDDRDEVYAQVTLHDQRFGDRTFNTPIWSLYFNT